jgi:hypothetical protein
MTASAVERYVPQGGALNYSNIQAALSVSTTGDIIRVQPGVYPESITFRSNFDVTLTSVNPLDSNIVQSTVIQGDGTRSVVSFSGGQTTNAVLTGFTIRGGGGTAFSVGTSAFQLGAGIYCYRSSPSIVGNIIENNRLDTNLTSRMTGGGGISCWESDARIVRNVLRNNSAYVGGAIVSVSGRPWIQDNWIYLNAATVGGGALLEDSGQFINNTVSMNSGGNLYVQTTFLVLNNIFSQARDGVGVIASESSGDPETWFRYNDIWGNEPVDMIRITPVLSNGVWTADYVPFSPAGTNGNLSVDPLFISATNLNFHLAPDSSCINAGDLQGIRSTNELDIDGETRLYALRVDLGADEFVGSRNFAPIAEAGSDRIVYWKGEFVGLDGSDSIDPNGSPLRFTWQQIAGPQVTLMVSNATAVFLPVQPGEYRFELLVNDGVYDSEPDQVQLVVTNLLPIASAGLGRSLPVVPETVMLDGSHSMDPEGQALGYQWHQISGPTVQWVTPLSARPVFKPNGPGVYGFELVVSDAYQFSVPDRVTYYIGQVPPIAEAGLPRYAGRTTVTLDGSGSFAPNNPSPLEYTWRQISGPSLILEKTNTAFPVVRGFLQHSNKVQEAEFELVVRAGEWISAPDTVKVMITPSWRNTQISLINPPFNPDKPTVIGFGGGNCDTGSEVGFPGTWRTLANLFTCSYSRDPSSPTTSPVYAGYGDQLITLLSAYAPAYEQAIQTMGFSTGNMPAFDVAVRFNTVYQDPRYTVNRIVLLDTGCSGVRDYSTNIQTLLTQRVPDEAFWIDNIYSAAGQYRPGTLNIEFPVPPAEHGTPNDWYFPSWNVASTNRPTNFNNGVFGGAFFSVIGPGKNYQLQTEQSEYYFGWTGMRAAPYAVDKLVQLSPSTCPARLPGLVVLTGPENGVLAKPGSVVLSCQSALNAVKYQILVGPSAHRLLWVAWEGQTPPIEPLAELSFARTYWTIRVSDAYGTTSQADPRYLDRDTDGDGLSDEAEVFAFNTNPDSADTDGDGRLDPQEVLAGTNPNSRIDEFHFGIQRTAKNELVFSWFTDSGKAYDLEFSPAVSPFSWQVIETIPAPLAGGFLQHSIATPQSPSGFYRLQAR